jgi:hypothetical protein
MIGGGRGYGAAVHAVADGYGEARPAGARWGRVQTVRRTANGAARQANSGARGEGVDGGRRRSGRGSSANAEEAADDGWSDGSASGAPVRAGREERESLGEGRGERSGRPVFIKEEGKGRRRREMVGRPLTPLMAPINETMSPKDSFRTYSSPFAQ